eukprot:4156861-Prymnesium_polylepis.1
MPLRIEVISALKSLRARTLRTRERQEKIQHEVDKLHVLKAARVRVRHLGEGRPYRDFAYRA